MLLINEQRFLQNLTDLANIGRIAKDEGGGLDRRPFSAAERTAREFFAERAQAAGLEVITDAAANLSARLPTNNPNAKTLLLGSHLDTVPNGGPYDGALGVIAALEVLRVVKENNLLLPFHLEAIAFTDEEGRFGDFFGSLALTGGHTPESIETFLTHANAFPDDLSDFRKTVPGGLTYSISLWNSVSSVAISLVSPLRESAPGFVMIAHFGVSKAVSSTNVESGYWLSASRIVTSSPLALSASI